MNLIQYAYVIHTHIHTSAQTDTGTHLLAHTHTFIAFPDYLH